MHAFSSPSLAPCPHTRGVAACPSLLLSDPSDALSVALAAGVTSPPAPPRSVSASPLPAPVHTPYSVSVMLLLEELFLFRKGSFLPHGHDPAVVPPLHAARLPMSGASASRGPQSAQPVLGTLSQASPTACVAWMFVEICSSASGGLGQHHSHVTS